MGFNMTKHDFILIAVLLLLALGGFLVYSLFFGAEGQTVRICIDGEIYREIPLDSDAEIEIPGLVGSCRLLISDGSADMTEADCPNQICVNHRPVSRSGETIICLPNRVSVEIME